jgi:cyclic pyranopterin phosphate synthase
MPAREELGADELLTLVRYLKDAAGIDKVRVTGGEPLITPKFDDFLLGLGALDLKDISLTTNAQKLSEKLDVISAAGLKRLNISLDTLNPLKFRQIARGGDLETVLEGIELALSRGIKLKINMVPMRTVNRDDVLPLLRFCLERGIELRFIELMRMGHLNQGQGFAQDFLSMQSLLDLIGAEYEYERTDAPFDSTAVRFKIPGQGTFGIIANESEPFCSACTRLRLSSDGYLYGCLSSPRRESIRDLLTLPRHLVLPQLQARLLSALQVKQQTFQGETTVMKFIGG